jgi:hypothetical protein
MNLIRSAWRSEVGSACRGGCSGCAAARSNSPSALGALLDGTTKLADAFTPLHCGPFQVRNVAAPDRPLKADTAVLAPIGEVQGSRDTFIGDTQFDRCQTWRTTCPGDLRLEYECGKEIAPGMPSSLEPAMQQGDQFLDERHATCAERRDNHAIVRARDGEREWQEVASNLDLTAGEEQRTAHQPRAPAINRTLNFEIGGGSDHAGECRTPMSLRDVIHATEP